MKVNGLTHSLSRGWPNRAAGFQPIPGTLQGGRSAGRTGAEPVFQSVFINSPVGWIGLRIVVGTQAIPVAKEDCYQ
jgi:hypothetical protein